MRPHLVERVLCKRLEPLELIELIVLLAVLVLK
jgi:hypothetical protein